MQLAEAKLAAFHDYAESRMCRRKLQALEQGDRAALRADLDKRATAARVRLRRQHEGELRFAETQMRGAEGGLARRMQARRQLLHRRYANLGDDMRHSHKVDLTQKPGMAFYTQPHFIKLRPNKPAAPGGGGGSATSRGSQLAALAASGQSRIPSLVQLYKGTLDLTSGPSSLEQVKLPAPTRPVT